MTSSRVERRGAGAAIGALLACLVLSAAVASAQGGKPDVNTVKSVRAVDGAIEIELHSSREFPVRDEVVVLRIGTKEFLRSRSPADGSLNTLIFIVSTEDFDALADGEPLVVKYGRSKDGTDAPERDHGPRWNFGRLNKALRR